MGFGEPAVLGAPLLTGRRASVFGVSGFGFGVSGLEFGVWGFGLRVWGFGLGVSGLGLRVLEFKAYGRRPSRCLGACRCFGVQDQVRCLGFMVPWP